MRLAEYQEGYETGERQIDDDGMDGEPGVVVLVQESLCVGRCEDDYSETEQGGEDGCWDKLHVAKIRQESSTV